MIHIATIHYKTEKWLDVQSRYIQRSIAEPFRIYAVLNGIKKSLFERFYFATEIEYPHLSNASAEHAAKLNYLAAAILLQAQDEDLLIFMDGDAFPISAHAIPFIREKIEKHKLLAIRRDETGSDFQAHPSFCATTVGFWKQLKGDWSLGFEWEDLQGGKVTDTGGELLRKLQEQKIDWFPMLRSNKMDLHPLWFGIYSNIIYHHGAGFRAPLCQLDRKLFPLNQIGKLRNHHRSSSSPPNKIIRLTGRVLEKLCLLRATRLQDKIYHEIISDEDFYLKFLKEE